MDKKKHNQDKTFMERLRSQPAEEQPSQAIVVNKTIYPVGKEMAASLPQDTPICAQQSCANEKPEIHRICHDFNFPPGTKILVCSTDGVCCYCYC